MDFQGFAWNEFSVNAPPLRSIGFVDDNDTGGNSRAIEQVCGQTNNALDIALVNDGLTDRRLCIATEQNTVGQNNRRLTGAFQGLQNVQQPCEVAVLLGRSVTVAVKTAILFQAVRPILERKGRIGYGKVKSLQDFVIGALFKVVGRRKSIACLNALLCRTRFILARPAVITSFS